MKEIGVWYGRVREESGVLMSGTCCLGGGTMVGEGIQRGLLSALLGAGEAVGELVFEFVFESQGGGRLKM